jgi:hypothetical protein
MIIHWEFSRRSHPSRSHPSREFGRVACLDEFSEKEFKELLDAYHVLVPHRVSIEAIGIQEIVCHERKPKGFAELYGR